MPHITTIEGQLVAKGLKFALVAGRFNDFITERLIGAPWTTSPATGPPNGDLTLVKVPGAFEIPLAAKKRRLGQVPGRHLPRRRHPGRHPISIRGQRVRQGPGPCHARNQCARGFGVLTVDTLEQAIERAGSKAGNKGVESAAAVLEMVRVLEQL